jgi:glycine/D-amino acid oxidase-like deaminating enzyme
MRSFDCLIVGQGIAGTAIAHTLKQNNRSFYVVDKGLANSSSSVAAGLVNPITGRRFVLSWKYPALRTYAESFYLQIESELEVDLIQPLEIIRSIHNMKEWNDWQSRSSDPLYQPFINEVFPTRDALRNFKSAFRNCVIRTGLQIDLAKLTKTYRSELIKSGLILEDSFRYDQMELVNDGIIYCGDIKASNIVFCEGYRATQNPFFSYLPFNPSKGEVLIVKTTEIDLKTAYKNKVFFIPLGDFKYWVGSYDRWKYKDEYPTLEGRHELIRRIESIMDSPYDIVRHKAAVRPTVKDRRPFIGRHDKYRMLWIFNGLGTKGALLAPYFANQLFEAIFHNKEPEPAVNIKRFS